MGEVPLYGYSVAPCGTAYCKVLCASRTRASTQVRKARAPAHHSRQRERPIFYCRATSASTAPRTPRRTCCPYASVLITVLRVSRSCELFPDGFDLHLRQLSPNRLWGRGGVWCTGVPEKHSCVNYCANYCAPYQPLGIIRGSAMNKTRPPSPPLSRKAIRKVGSRAQQGYLTYKKTHPPWTLP